MSRSPFLKSLPNLITVGRLILVPVAIAAIGAHGWMGAFLVFMTAGISDGVDGFIARHFDLRTELGAYLDALADKALLISIYVALAVENVLPSELAILVVSRDVMIIGAVMVSWVLDRPVEIRPLLVSKINTLAQISLAGLVLGAQAFAIGLGGWLTVMIVVVSALTLGSMAAYLAQWLRHMSG